MSDITRIKDKLAKLLRLGEDNAATPGEIDNALTLATQMMAKYQLTRSDIDLNAADPTSRVTLGRHFAFCTGIIMAPWEATICNFVESFIGSVACYKAGKMPVRKNGIADFFGAPSQESRQACAIAFYGCDDDARAAMELFEELSSAISTMSIIRWGGWARGDGAAYSYGFASAIRNAHRNAHQELSNVDSYTSALMIRSAESSLAIVNHAKDWLSTTHNVKIGKARKGKPLNFNSSNASAAFEEGRRDGNNYNVSRPGARHQIA